MKSNSKGLILIVLLVYHILIMVNDESEIKYTFNKLKVSLIIENLGQPKEV